MDAANGILSREGYLVLDEDPELQIHFDNTETCNEADDNTTNTTELEEGSTSQQNISSHQLLDQPDATPVFKDYNFDGRDNNHINTNLHSCNQEMPENMICLNEVLKESEKRITAEQQSSPKQLLHLPDSIRDSNSIGSSDLIGNNNHRAISPSQNQEGEPISLGDCDKMITEDNSLCDKTDVSYRGNSLNSLEENKKRKKPRGKGKVFTLEEIERLEIEGRTVSEAGRILGVSESTFKRRCRELGISSWPSFRQHRTNMRKASNIDGLRQAATSQNVTSCGTSESNGVVSDSTADETVRAEKEPPMKSQCRYQQGQEHLNGTKESAPSTTGQPKSSWSNCIVKARSEESGDIGRFEFPLSSNIDQLKEEIGRKLELEVGKFKMKYEDNEGDWVLVTCITDLKHALSLSKSNIVRLSVIPKT